MKRERMRGDGRVYLRGDIWWMRYYAHGQEFSESTEIRGLADGDRRKAENKLRDKVAEVRLGIHQDTRSIRYEDLRASYFADYQTNGRKSLRRDKDGKPYLDKVTRLDGYFTGFRASEIDTDSVRKFMLDQQGRGLANGTINRSLAALKRMFNVARQDGRLRNVPYIPMLKEAAPRQGFFERGQFEALSTALPEHLRLPLAIGFYTGMRLGEILSLRWKQVDFLNGLISLRAGETKNDEAREVPIVPQLRVLLVERHAKRHGCDYVCFQLDRSGRADKIGGFRKAWYSACVKSGLGAMVQAIDRASGKPLYDKPRGPKSKAKPKMVYEGMIFHDLRRTGVRNLVRAGVPEKVAQGISGHKTRSIFERYNIVSRNDVAEAGRKLAAFHGAENQDKTGTIATYQQPANPPVN